MKKKIIFGLMSSALISSVAALSPVQIANGENLKNNNVTNIATTKERLIIQFDEENRESIKEKLKNIPNTIVKYEYSELLTGISLETDSSNIKAITDIPGVKLVEKSRKIKPKMYTAKELSKVIQSSPKYKFDGRGMVIALIDSGLDTKHKDMRLDAGVEPKIKSIKESIHGTYTEKIPYGFNYVEGNDELMDLTDKPHGMHLAGILAGNATDEEIENKTGIDGVAPNAQLLAYKIFSDNPKKFTAETEDSAYAAMEDAVKRGADVISLSVGYYDSGLPGNAYYKIAERAAQKGIVITAAIGNAGTSSSTTSYDLKANNAFNMIDTATTVGVAATPSVIGVGSVRNTNLVQYQFNIDDLKLGYYPMGISKVTSADYNFEYLESNKKEYIKEKDLTGKVAVIKRDGADVRELVRNLKVQGAIGIILINSNRTINRDYYNTHIEFVFDKDLFNFSNIWGVTMSGEDGDKLINKIKSNKNKMTLKNDNLIVSREIIKIPEISGFSSWGPTVNLELKPEIVAPGEDIYSTLNGSTYGTMSGTSMASPFVAGSSTLLLPKVNSMTIPEGMTKVGLLKLFLMNTAMPVMDRIDDKGNKLENSPRQQGAGMMQLQNALDSDVIIYHNNKGGVELKEIDKKETFEITLQNLGKEVRSFNISSGKVLTSTNISVTKQNAEGTEVVKEVHSAELDNSSISLSANSISLNPGEVKKITVQLDAGVAQDQFAEGYIYFKSTDKNHPDLSIPYFGFVGDWSKEKIVDSPAWENDSNTRITSVVSTYKYSNGEKYIELGRANPKDPNSAVNPDDIAISANGSNSIIGSANLRFAILRDIVGYEIDVVDSPKEDANIIKRIDKGSILTRYRHIDFFEDETYKSSVLTPKELHNWNGTIYDPLTGDTKQAEDGQYYFRIKVKNKENGKYQYTYLPIKIDSIKPEFKNINKEKLKTEKEITFTASDNNKVWDVVATLDGKSVEVEKISTENGLSTYKIKNVELTENGANELNLEIIDIAGNTINHKEILEPYNIKFENIDELDKNKKEYSKFKATLTNNVNSVEVYLDNSLLESTKENNKLEFSINDIKDGEHTLKVVLKDSKNKEIETKTYKFVRDTTEPTVTYDVKYDESNPKLVKLEENGRFTIKGNVKDNISKNENLKIVYYAPEALTDNILKIYKKQTIKPDKDGNFELTLFKSDYPTAVFIDVIDEKGNKYNKKKFNTVEEGFDDQDTEEVDNTVLLHNTGLNSPVYFGSESLERPDFEEKDGKYIFTFKLQSDEEGYSVSINDGEKKSFLENEDGDIDFIEYPVELKEEFNIVDLKIYNQSGKLIRSNKYHIYFDNHEPVLELDNLIEESSEKDIAGVILASKEGKLTISGSAEDNGIYWGLNINGNLVERGGIWREYGNNKKSFSYTLNNLKDNDIVSLRLTDRFGNEVKHAYKVKIDDSTPNILIKDNSLEDGKTYNKGIVPKIEVTDKQPKNLKVEYLLNGEPYKLGTPINNVGKNTLEIKAINNSSNEAVKKISFNILSDLTATLKKSIFTNEELMKISDFVTVEEGINIDDVKVEDTSNNLEKNVIVKISNALKQSKTIEFKVQVEEMKEKIEDEIQSSDKNILSYKNDLFEAILTLKEKESSNYKLNINEVKNLDNMLAKYKGVSANAFELTLTENGIPVDNVDLAKFNLKNLTRESLLEVYKLNNQGQLEQLNISVVGDIIDLENNKFNKLILVFKNNKIINDKPIEGKVIEGIEILEEETPRKEKNINNDNGNSINNINNGNTINNIEELDTNKSSKEKEIPQENIILDKQESNNKLKTFTTNTNNNNSKNSILSSTGINKTNTTIIGLTILAFSTLLFVKRKNK
ncbi:S8 family serine peptidase [Gemelliphila palaticanis]|uniref:S8 family serine peptidase n=1 Tax=Gemelliphila palaticanis TaxID=81950 RepID=A0ABX2SZD2_9BACL|nr:S8 family serine peptidase [Gemella palaticanis]MBF0715507.1 S8 family serine peptidase [Gemella palaticanis]NYS47437.1 S8 family serine peptidase [Gemella palaticanis]